MRVFIGIKLLEHVHENLDNFLKPFKRMPTPIRWVNQENIHITLKFIGEVLPEKYKQIEMLLSGNPLIMDPFNLKLVGCGKFGRANSLNIFWVGLSPYEPLIEIYNHLENSLSRIGIMRDERPFKPHITVGRNKKDYNFRSLFQLIEENSQHFISEFSASHFQIFKSELRPEGPIYTILKEIPLVQA